MDPLSSAAFNIATNLATVIVQNNAQRLDDTLAGQALKKVGLIKPNQPTLADELRQTLREALLAFQNLGPQYKLEDLTNFFSDSLVGRHICDTILNHRGISQQALDEMLDRYFKKQGILAREFQANGGIPENIFPDFFKCYRQVLQQHVNIGEIAVLLAIYDGNSEVITAIQKSSSQQNDRFDAIEKLIREQIQLIQQQHTNVSPAPNPAATPPSQTTFQGTQTEKDTSQRSISAMARFIHSRRSMGEQIILFLGARTSGLYGNSKLYADIQANSARSVEWDTLTEAEKFRECYRVLQTSTQGEVDTLLKFALHDAPRWRNEDILLAELIGNGYFDTVISTGIDVFLEYALNKEAEQNHFVYQLVKYGRENNDYIIQQHRAGTKVIKLFGDIKSSSFNTPKREFELGSRANRDLRNYLEEVFSKDMLMIGYDPSWDAPLSNAFLPARPGLIYFVNEEEPAESSHMRHVIEKRDTRLTGSQKSFAAFIEALHEELQKREKNV